MRENRASFRLKLRAENTVYVGIFLGEVKGGQTAFEALNPSKNFKNQISTIDNPKSLPNNLFHRFRRSPHLVHYRLPGGRPPPGPRPGLPRPTILSP